MKRNKTFLSICIALFSLNSFAQGTCDQIEDFVKWEYDFEDSWLEDNPFNDNPAPSCWYTTGEIKPFGTTEAPSYIWSHTTEECREESNGCAKIEYSEYFVNTQTPNSKNNAKLITPSFQLGDNSKLSFWAKGYGDSYNQIKISLAIIPDDESFTEENIAQLQEFNIVKDLELTEDYTLYEYDLGDFNGKYRVIFVSDGGFSDDEFGWGLSSHAYLDDVKLTTEPLLSTNEINKQDKVNIYPNPTNGIVNIASEHEIKTIKVFDSVGKLLKQESSKKSINLSAYKGVLILQVETIKGVSSEKVVVR